MKNIKPKTVNPLMNNKGKILRQIIAKKTINRSALAKLASISIPSVMAITDELIERNLIHSVGKGESNGGKRPELLSVIADSEYYVGVDIGKGSIRLIIADLSQTIVFGKQEKTGSTEQPELFCDRLYKFITQCIVDSKIDDTKIVGVGIAMPGLINSETGHVIFSPDFSWSDIPLQQWMEEKLNYPTIVENANRALALSESNYIMNTDQTIFCVNLGHGIGGALVQNGKLFLGSSGTSGEIGHITMDKNGPLCSCGNVGCLEALASGDAIAKQGQTVVVDGQETLLSQLCENNINNIDAKMVFDAAKQGDFASKLILNNACEYIGIALSNTINLLDPDTIILCGGLIKNGDLLTKPVIASAKKHRMRQAGRYVKIIPSSNGDYATAIGASQIVFYNGWRIPKLKHFYI